MTIPVPVAETAAPVVVAEGIGIGIDIDIEAWSMLIELDPISIFVDSCDRVMIRVWCCAETESRLDCLWNCERAKSLNR